MPGTEGDTSLADAVTDPIHVYRDVGLSCQHQLLQVLNCVNGFGDSNAQRGANCVKGGFATNVWTWISEHGGVTTDSALQYNAGVPSFIIQPQGCPG